ncbi:hypothetical protein FGG08_007088 [Glutinoglossum americanum]|uniref:Cytochrome P450 n=1 Tax=Glutinoglossum americanum TaxID=1670608 RepID=A0A9P8I269_9PEZI|nr:hypothetical protein FGG08_007088 [Glutinoglossum americanum]
MVFLQEGGPRSGASSDYVSSSLRATTRLAQPYTTPPVIFCNLQRLQYSKEERPFVLPNILCGHEVILPMSQMRWLLEQPDHILNQHEVNKQALCADRTMLDHNIIGEAHLRDFIRRSLTRDLDTHAGAIVEEIEDGLEAFWGSDTENWREVTLYDGMLGIIGQLVNRVFVGLPLCRDPEFLHTTMSFAHLVVLTAGFINLLPSWLKPIFGPVVTAYDKFQYRKIARVIEPIVRKRALSLGPGVALQKQDFSQPNDYIQWALREAYTHSDVRDRSPEMITKRLAVLGFAAIHSSAISITNVLFDIAASGSSLSIQHELRLEAKRTAEKASNSAWNKASLAGMVMTDSILRESMRLWGIISHGVTKSVIAKEGVTLPSGEHLPYGTKCGITSYGPHHDQTVYDNPYTFDPFRFCRDKLSGATDSSSKSANATPTAFVTTTDYYMGFSHGRNACPGRFFASQQLKLLLAHVMLKYEIEPIPSRPENQWLNNAIGPPVKEKIRIRRRKDDVSYVTVGR